MKLICIPPNGYVVLYIIPVELLTSMMQIASIHLVAVK
jgi:hypothetical protein